jgi:hypothetical protein
MRSYREGGATFSTGNYQMESRHAAIIVTATLHDKSRSARREQAMWLDIAPAKSAFVSCAGAES